MTEYEAFMENSETASQRSQEISENPIPENSIHKRTDTLASSIVDLGITLQRVGNTKRAAYFLKENDISLAVALRVLTQPHLRRKSNGS
ncbi:hypothetical protein [Noviherbaspirillum humi]|uniref:hypothetical protein n=1 Tax=Noviherbaspirillum humi TaxID=1688639 RepID=UPI0011604C4C|nr:hypothetical protein [Noviherbaspirillum humi]